MPPITQYAALSDLAVAGIAASAISGFTSDQQNAALVNASRLLDDYLANKFKLPLLAIDASLTRATCIIAAYDLMVSRGYNPSAGGDPLIEKRYREIIGIPPHQLGWADLVANGKITPAGIVDSSPDAASGRPASRPAVVSSSQRGFAGRPGTSTDSNSFTGRFTTD